MRIPLFYNHNGGDIHFGPDNYLYWSTGSGTGSFDPEDLAQNLWKKNVGNIDYFLMGKILRLNVRATTASASANMCGRHRRDNRRNTRFRRATRTQARPTPVAEIWAYGFRNPWRFSIDRANGDLYIGDVRRRQLGGDQPLSGSGRQQPQLRLPAMRGQSSRPPRRHRQYLSGHLRIPGADHGVLACQQPLLGGRRRALIAAPIGPLNGDYIFGDSCTSEVFVGSQGGGGNWSFTVFDSNIDPGYGTVVAFGEGQNGDLFLVDHQNGNIWRFDSAASDLIFANGFD
jgi:glucose/arabinose dehydrogenase